MFCAEYNRYSVFDGWFIHEKFSMHSTRSASTNAVCRKIQLLKHQNGQTIPHLGSFVTGHLVTLPNLVMLC